MELEIDQREAELKSIVSRVMAIESVRIEPPNSPAVAEYFGHLTKDSMQAYDQLAEALKHYKLTPVMKNEDDGQLIALLDVVFEQDKSNPWVNVGLFIVTIFSVLFAGTMYSYDGPMPNDPVQQIFTLLKNLDYGISFAASLLGILLAHEFGHYLMARRHNTPVTLPYFIPFPLNILGTMGAFIQLKAPPKNKRVLHDIGVTGPLAGLVVAIPILLIGLSLSHVETVAPQVPEGMVLTFEGNSLFYLAAKYLFFGEALPAPQSYGDMSPFLYWVRYFFTGQPAPLGARDVIMHPLVWAGWAGLLVTSLNLIPAGQLDGGHALYVLIGEKAKRIVPFILGALVLMGFAWQGWWLWAGLIFLLGRRHAEPLDQVTELDPRRKMIATITLVIFFLIFMPIPLLQFQ